MLIAASIQVGPVIGKKLGEWKLDDNILNFPILYSAPTNVASVYLQFNIVIFFRLLSIPTHTHRDTNTNTHIQT